MIQAEFTEWQMLMIHNSLIHKIARQRGRISNRQNKLDNLPEDDNGYKLKRGLKMKTNYLTELEQLQQHLESIYPREKLELICNTPENGIISTTHTTEA